MKMGAYKTPVTPAQSTLREVPNIFNKSNISLITGVQVHYAMVVMSTAVGRLVQMN
jgi:hypothetical protein